MQLEQDAGRGRLIPKYPWENMLLGSVARVVRSIQGDSKASDSQKPPPWPKDGARRRMDGLGKWPNLLGISQHRFFQFIFAVE